MASTDIEKLVVQLSADIRSFDKELARMNGIANRQFSAIERRARQLNKNLDGIFAKSFQGLSAAFTGVTAALGTAELIRLADTWTELKSRVDLAAGSMEGGEAVMMRLADMARRTYSSLEETAESWLSNSTALKEMGYSTKQQLDLTETLNNALVISAAKGDRAASVMNAWSKAMALGKLSGDNLNTIIQSGGRLAEALAASMGVSTNQLRALGQQGKITTKEMYGVTSQLEQLQKEAESMPATVGDAITQLKNSLLLYVGGADQASQTSAKLAESILLLARNFNDVADTALKLSTIVVSALTGRAIFGMIATLPTATTSVMALVAAMRAGTLTATGFTAALGPIGLLLGATAGALYVLSQHQDAADIAAEEHRKSIVLLNQEIADLDYANKAAVQSTRDKIRLDIEAAKTALERAKAERELARSIIEGQIRSRTWDPDKAQGIIDKQMGNSLSLFTKEVELQQKIIADLEKSLQTLETNVSNPPTRLSLGGHGDGDGKGKKSTKERADEYERLAQRIADSTAALVAETEVQRTLNPLIDDHGYAVEKARAEQELLNAALKAGKEITPELRAQIAQLADQYATATAEASRLAESQDQIRQASEFFRDAMMDSFKEIVPAIETGNKALDKFLNTLMDAVLQASLLGKGPLAGIFGGGKGLLSLFGFAAGGYTGPGGKYEPKGVVHGGEYVFSKEAVQKAGVGNLDAMHRNLKGYASGGFVAPTMPSLARVGAGGNSSGTTIVKVLLSPDLEARILDQAAGQSVQIVQASSTGIVQASVGATQQKSRNNPGFFR